MKSIFQYLLKKAFLHHWARVFLLSASLSLVTEANENEASDNQRARIIGKLNDGSPSAVAPKKALPNYKVFWETRVKKAGKDVIMQEVQAPNLLNSQKTIKPTSETNNPQNESLDLIRHSVSVVATIYNRTYTHLEIYCNTGGEAQKVEAWSNIDWNYMEGFTTFEGRGQSFSFMLFADNKKIEPNQQKDSDDIAYPPSNLPNIDVGSRYSVIQQSGTNDSPLEFLETIHELYDEAGETLKKAYSKRESRKHITKTKPKDSKQVKMLFWNNDKNLKK